MNMIEKRKAQAGQGGFTLIELLVVVAILAVLAGAAIIGIGAMRDNAKKNACKSEKDTIETALEAWDVDHDTAGSATIAAALGSGYLKKTSNSDWNTTYTPTGGWSVSPATTGKYNGVTCS